ncbi:hypothetical protein [Mycobacterium sp.]
MTRATRWSVVIRSTVAVPGTASGAGPAGLRAALLGGAPGGSIWL